MEHLAVEEIPAPTPQRGEVLVRVEAVGINQLDLNVIAGVGPGAAARLPRTLGIDPVGRVVKLGADVPDALLGLRVAVKPNIPCGRCDYCRSEQEGLCPAQSVVGVHRDGGAAEFVAVPASSVFAIDDIPVEHAVAAMHSLPIVIRALHAAGDVSAGQTVVVSGVSGVLGHVAAQYALDRGAQVIGCARRSVAVPDGVELVVAAPSDLGSAIRQKVPDGADLALDTTGSATVAGELATALGWAGRLALCTASVSTALSLDMRALYLQRQTVVGSASAHYSDVRLALDLVRRGVVTPRIDRAFDLSSISEAYARFTAENRTGKVVVHVAPAQ